MAEGISKRGGAAHLTQIYCQRSLVCPCCTAGWACAHAGAVGFHSCGSSLDAVVFCPVGLKAPLQPSFPKERKQGSDTAAHMATAPHRHALPCTRAAGSSAPCAWVPLWTTQALPSLSSPSYFHHHGCDLTEMPLSLEGSPAPLSWLETNNCWMQDRLKKVWVKADSGAMPPS